MQGITVQQPYARDIINGDQGIECRSWRMHKLPTRIVIVSGKFKGNVPDGEISNYLYGYAIGTVSVEECVQVDGSWEWMLVDPRPIIPFQWRGKMGIYRIPDQLIMEDVA